MKIRHDRSQREREREREKRERDQTRQVTHTHTHTSPSSLHPSLPPSISLVFSLVLPLWKCVWKHARVTNNKKITRRARALVREWEHPICRFRSLTLSLSLSLSLSHTHTHTHTVSAGHGVITSTVCALALFGSVTKKINQKKQKSNEQNPRKKTSTPHERYKVSFLIFKSVPAGLVRGEQTPE